MAIQYKVYFRAQGDSWIYQGATFDLEWDISAYDFDYFNIYEWRVDTYDTETELTTTGDTWEFITIHSYVFPHDRRNDYDPDLVWGWDSVAEEYAWLSPTEFLVTGGGRYKHQLVAVGFDSNGIGSVYFGDI